MGRRVGRLQARGLLDGDAQLTPRGRELRAGDRGPDRRGVASPVARAGSRPTGRLLELLGRWSGRWSRPGILPEKVTRRLSST